MNRNRIRIAISLMACALFVIVVVQYYWVNGLYIQNNGRFDRDIRIVLNATQNKIGSEDLQDNPEILNFLKDQNPVHDEFGNIKFYKKSNSIEDYKYPSDYLEPIDNLELNDFTKSKKEFLKLTLKWANNTYDKIVAINKLKKTITIDINKIKSLLSTSMEEREINAEYEFAVTNDLNQFIYRSDPSIDKVVYLNSNYHKEFFLIGGNKRPNHIHLVIKKKFAYILSDLKPIIYILVLMILIIMASFYYALRIIFNQKKLSEIKTDFINNMTHELKTPISTISLALEALLQFGLQSDPQRGKKYLEICKSENKRLGTMVENVLNAAAYQKGELNIKPEEINLHSMLSEVIQNIEVQIIKNKGFIKADFNSTEEIIQADKVHFTNIFFNLLDNANKYYRDTPRITIKTYNDGSNIYIEISDQGIGMRKEDQKRIFDRFYRVPTGNVHNVKGYGLGLSYVYDVVKKHGGTISVDSEFGKGTTFKIKLSYGREN